MNKFEPKTGGHPLKLDEFNLMQDAYFDGFKALIYKLSPTGNVILQGFNVDYSGPANVVYTSGYISIAGEIFQIPSGSFPVNTSAPSDNLYVMPVTVPPDDGQPGAADPTTYEDTTTHNVHITRVAVLKYYDSSTDTNGVFYSDLSVPGIMLEGAIIPWYPPQGKSVSDYFDSTGLGINSAVGYAICNGNNNTLDLRGMFLSMTTNAFSNAPLNALLGSVTADAGTEIGNNTNYLTKGQLPNYNLTLTLSDPGHTHDIIYSSYTQRGSTNSSFGTMTGIKPNNVAASGTTTTMTGRTEKNYTNMSVTGQLGGSGLPIENRPPTKYLYYITKLR